MKRLVLSALLSAVVALAACDSGSPTSAAPSDPRTLISEPVEPVLPGDPPLEPPTDSTTYPPADTTTSPPPVIEYRIVTGLYRSGGDMKAYTEFQRGYNGSWSRADTYHISVYCYVNGSYRDGESESNASLVHITFGESYRYGKQITCNHSANHGQYTATTSYTM